MSIAAIRDFSGQPETIRSTLAMFMGPANCAEAALAPMAVLHPDKVTALPIVIAAKAALLIVLVTLSLLHLGARRLTE
jgi:hypothetical protein